MSKTLGEHISEHRANRAMTQDEFGAKYGVSGPAIFKFEKGYVHPSLILWLKISDDMDIPERKAVLMHVRSKLPAEFHGLINPDAKAKTPRKSASGKGTRTKDYKAIAESKSLKSTAKKDTTLPKGLRDLLADDNIWESFKPSGSEITILRDSFGPLGRSGKSTFREALRLIRQFSESY